LRKLARTSDRLRLLLCWIAAGALELPILSWLLLSEPLAGPVSGTVFHFAAAALIFFAPPKAGGWTSPLRHWGEPMALWTLAFPGLGWLLAGALFLAEERSGARKDFFLAEELRDDAMEAAPVPLEPEHRSVQRRLLDAADIMPAADVLLGRDTGLKRGAVEALARIRTPEAIEWLLRARTDGDPEVRFHATSTLTTLRRDYESKIRAAEREVFENPSDPRRRLAHERIVYSYAMSGLVDGERRREMLEDSRARLAPIAGRETGALELLFRIKTILDPGKALDHLPELVARAPERALEWSMARAVLLFKLSRFDETRAAMTELRGQDDAGQDPDWQAALLWWTRG